MSDTGAASGDGTGGGDDDRSVLADDGGDAFLVTEVERYGVATQDLRADGDALPTGPDGVVLSVDASAEDRSGRDALVLVSPELSDGDGPAGRLVLTIAPAGAEAVAVGHVAWSTAGTDDRIDPASVSVSITVTGGGPDGPDGAELSGRWGYSLRPRVRTVFVADDEGAFGDEATVVHVADLGAEPVTPELGPADDGDHVLTFTVPSWVTGQLDRIRLCELLADRLAVEAGDDDLRLPADLATIDGLDRVATEIEGARGDGLGLAITIDQAGRELVRGQRLQPLVTWPITIVGVDGEPTAARLGCAVSG